MDIGHVRYNGHNFPASFEKLDEIGTLLKQAKRESVLHFEVDDGAGKDLVVWTPGAPISLHYWEANHLRA